MYAKSAAKDTPSNTSVVQRTYDVGFLNTSKSLEKRHRPSTVTYRICRGVSLRNQIYILLHVFMEVKTYMNLSKDATHQQKFSNIGCLMFNSEFKIGGGRKGLYPTPWSVKNSHKKMATA